ncbi:hypothetical protein [Actinoplanes xinjiangensis]|uniref:Uncharacterized protein n=1 Tax=Actinoplanes xinjiangensis TaxID=512350 RepID=A0A316F676_9ACTN|nr:hypothetical protein [Actinoplanes xinjiangensis]PWK39293.1 hypothetical protein BC793_123130 [Actinoplanes xinjiangensis]
MDVNTGGSSAERPADVVVELSAAEAAGGTAKTIAAPPDGTPVLIYFPPGARDGMVQNVDLPWVDPASGAASTRTVSVAVRVLPAGPFPTAAAGGAAPFGPGYPQPGYAPAGYAPAGFAAPPQRRFGTRARVVAGALGIALIGGLCLVPTLLRDSNADTTSGVSGLTSTTTATQQTEAAATPTTPPLEPAAFQASLDDANRQLTAAVGKLRQATTPRAVSGAADALAEAVRTQTSALSGLTPPAAVSSAYSDLVSALSALEDELTSVSSSADSRSVCTGGSASTAFSRAGAAGDLRTAITALAAADPGAKYRFGSFLPGATKDQNRRKANGSYLTRTTGGSGQLKVDNGNNADTVINLVKVGSKKPAVSVYIRGKKKVTTGRIKDGTYQVFVSSGADWDGKRFTRDCQFSKFDSSFKFTTTSRQYTIWELSLKAVLGGNARSSDVDPDSFPS